MRGMIALGWVLVHGCGDGRGPGDADGDADTDADSDADRCCRSDPGQAGWRRETITLAREVARPRRVGGFSAAIDPDGAVRVGYGDGSSLDGAILYATNRGETWTTWTVDAVSLGLDTTAIALDASGAAHLAYTANVAREDSSIVDVSLRYATEASGPWSVLTVTDLGEPHGSAIDIDVLGDGAAHLGFFLGAATAMHGTNAGGDWTIQSIGDGNGSAEQRTAIAFDGAGILHAAYRGPEAAFDLLHATRSEDAWTLETVDATGTAGGNPSLAIAEDGVLHVAFRFSEGAIADSELRYATNESGAWVVETVETAREGGRSISLALDGSGGVHIGHGAASEVHYATNVGGAWAIEPVTSVGGDLALVVDSAGEPHILYFDECRDAVRHTWRARDATPECEEE